MSYIIKKNEPLVNLKLTDLGRQNLANGLLNFKSYGLGDSEMNYTTDKVVEQNIFRPVDRNPDIQYPLGKTGTNYINVIDSTYAIPTVINNAAKERGFFVNNNDDRSELDINLMEFADLKISSDNFIGTNIIDCIIDGDTYVKSAESVIEIGDYLFVKLIKPTNTDVLTPSHIETNPVMYLWYVINGVVEITSGYTVTVDRETIDFGSQSGLSISQAYLYKGSNIVENFDHQNPTAYWENGLLDFSSNNTYVTEDVPLWNFNIYSTQDIVGVNNIINKGKENTAGELFSGAYPYFRYADANNILKIGIIHYTNNTVSNFYGEGFFEDTLELHLPSLMWHKKTFNGPSTATNIGYTFICDSELQIMDNNLRYYNLIDQETTPTIVGKVFTDQKVVIIEDPELIVAMSIKSNRNFTLPKPVLSLVTPGTVCNEASKAGSLKQGQTMYVTYMLGSWSESLWYQPCENIASISLTDASISDVTFKFDTTVSNFAYLFKSGKPYGYNADKFYLLTQIVTTGEKPQSDNWKYFDATNYLGSSGCLSNQLVLDDTTLYQLKTDTSFVTTRDLTKYELSNTPAGKVLVSVNGVIQKEAASIDKITYESLAPLEGRGDYIYDSATTSVYFGPIQNVPSGHPATKLNIGDIIQIHYLYGQSDFGAVQQSVTVPVTIPEDTAGAIYQSGGIVYMDLNEDPEGEVYLMYNGIILSNTNYDVVIGGGNNYSIKLLFTPIAGSIFSMFYASATATSSTGQNWVIKPADFDNLQINIDYNITNAVSVNLFQLGNFIILPTSSETTLFTFGDENFFFGNLSTNIRATIYKTLFTINVLPNTFRTSLNPTFNADTNKVSITEIGIYDADDDLVAMGKFSQPLTRTSYADLLVIQASIDF